jgi:hypothetical protein
LRYFIGRRTGGGPDAAIFPNAHEQMAAASVHRELADESPALT